MIYSEVNNLYMEAAQARREAVALEHFQHARQMGCICDYTSKPNFVTIKPDCMIHGKGKPTFNSIHPEYLRSSQR